MRLPGPVAQEGVFGTGVVVRVALDGAAPSVSDQRESTLQGDHRQATPAMGLVDEDAGDPVAGQDVELLLVLIAVVDVRHLLGGPELAPGHDLLLVQNQGGMRTPLLHQPALQGTVRLLGALLVRVHGVEQVQRAGRVVAHSPTSPPAPVGAAGPA